MRAFTLKAEAKTVASVGNRERGLGSFVTWFFGHNNIANRSVEQRTQLPWQLSWPAHWSAKGRGHPSNTPPFSLSVCALTSLLHSHNYHCNNSKRRRRRDLLTVTWASL